MAGNKNIFGPNVMTVQEATNQIAQRRIVRVTPELSTLQYGDNEVLFDATEIPNAVIRPGGCSKLIAISIVSQQTDQLDLDIVFMQVQKNLGTRNAAIDISDDNLEAAKVIGAVRVDGSDVAVGLSANIILTFADTHGDNMKSQLPLLLQAETNTTSVYFSAILRDTTPTYAADDLDFIFHIEY